MNFVESQIDVDGKFKINRLKQDTIYLRHIYLYSSEQFR